MTSDGSVSVGNLRLSGQPVFRWTAQNGVQVPMVVVFLGVLGGFVFCGHR
jgi:hypothetical protein